MNVIFSHDYFIDSVIQFEIDWQSGHIFLLLFLLEIALLRGKL